MDRIFLHGMRFMACHGVLPHEREVLQAFEADVKLCLDLREAGETDELRNTVNYAEVYELIRRVIEGAPKALIESLAEDAVTQILAAFPRIRSVTFTVHKPAAPIAGIFADVGVSITRDRG
ncbi:dihydroneopterin aldolase [uncultured Selenomonas sp.]|uniref:dihydroneopterin aldolase n=1 Tax=uncultured Selenomonas sp. TaxID=159275 RepID=UPI0028E417DA|nr:dihydroneopterin aldolase [uncultured Selenomonas sp.]